MRKCFLGLSTRSETTRIVHDKGVQLIWDPITGFLCRRAINNNNNNNNNSNNNNNNNNNLYIYRG